MAAEDRHHRLPTLAEVIKRQSKPPVDLYVFYLFLQREGSEDVLDFWLDVQQHENLCRAYFKDLRKSGRTVQEDWPQFYDYARRRGSIFNKINGIQRDPNLADDEKRDSDALFALDRSQTPRLSTGGDETEMRSVDAKNLTGHLSPTLQQMYPSPDPNVGAGRRSTLSRKEPVQPIIQRQSAITRTDLVASAEVIFAKYFLQGAEKEIYLPSPLRIHTFPLSADRLPHMSQGTYDMESEAMARIPDMFNRQKDYVYRAMERDTYPRFLRTKAFGNLTPQSAIFRLCLGLLAMWAGFATAFSFVFLDTRKALRLWVILPFSIGLLLIIEHFYDLDPLLVFLGLSETTPFRTVHIREPYVKKLLVGRGVWVMVLTTMITACLSVLFVLVPGHRL